VNIGLSPRMKHILVHVCIGFLGISVVSAALLFTLLGKWPLQALLPISDIEYIDFKTQRFSDKPNQFLVCPLGICHGEEKGVSPEFYLSVETLAARWRAMVSTEQRVEILDDQGLKITYVQRSARFRFPDIITVQFFPLSPSRSTLAVYSRAVYGRYDFGVNRERVKKWLGNIRT